jgi:hypothetical protein
LNKTPDQPAHSKRGLSMVAFQIFGAVMILLSLGTMMTNDIRGRG